MWRLLVVLVVAKFLVTVDEDLKSDPSRQGILPILDVLQAGMNIIKPRLISSQEHRTNILSFPSG